MGGGGGTGITALASTAFYVLEYAKMDQILNSALSGAGPYNTAFAYNPEDDLDAALDAWDTLSTEIGAYPTWASLVSTATSQTNTAMYPTSDISAAVTAFESDQATRFAKQVGMLAAGMADAGSALTSAFPFGVAMLALEAAKNSDNFEAQLALDRQRQRMNMIMTGISQEMQMVDAEIDAKTKSAQLRADISKLTISAQTSRLKDELYIDVQDALWDLSLFTYAGNFMAAQSGGVSQLAGIPGPGQQVLSNATGMLSALGPLLAAL